MTLIISILRRVDVSLHFTLMVLSVIYVQKILNSNFNQQLKNISLFKLFSVVMTAFLTDHLNLILDYFCLLVLPSSRIKTVHSDLINLYLICEYNSIEHGNKSNKSKKCIKLQAKPISYAFTAQILVVKYCKENICFSTLQTIPIQSCLSILCY